MPDFDTKGFNYKGEMVYKNNSSILRSAIEIPRQDDDGAYTEFRDVHRALIDAACLRTNHKIYDTYINFLYSTNNFYFGMTKASVQRSPPTMLLKGKDFKVWRPRPYKPGFDAQGNADRALAISQISNQVYIKALSGWAYHDPFLRFLYTIGPKNAARLKHITFSGTVKIHTCRAWICGEHLICDDDLGSSLRNYIPFIIALCTGLEKLTIRAKEDENIDPVFQPLDVGMPATREDVLRPIFEKELRSITSLKKLEAVGRVEWEREGLEFADETIAWFENRERHRILRELETEKTKQQDKIAGGTETAGE